LWCRLSSYLVGYVQGQTNVSAPAGTVARPYKSGGMGLLARLSRLESLLHNHDGIFTNRELNDHSAKTTHTQKTGYDYAS
jgi:hypothetical protein